MKFISIVFLSLLFVSNSLADSWGLPPKKLYCSENKKYCLKIIPKKIQNRSGSFTDRVDGNAETSKSNKESSCQGEFFERNSKGKLEKKWTKKLVNEIAPVNAVVSNDGKYIVTFDNWYSVGYGDNVVTIYSTTGEIINKFGLDYFLTESQLQRLPITNTSIWWYGKRWIDENKQELVLEVVMSETRKEYFQIRFNLSDGKLKDKKETFALF